MEKWKKVKENRIINFLEEEGGEEIVKRCLRERKEDFELRS